MKTLSLAIAAVLAAGAIHPATAAAIPDQLGPTYHCAPAAAHVPCSAWLPYTGGNTGTLAHRSFTALPAQGTTKTTITKAFPGIILWAFTYNPDINAQVAAMPTYALASLSHNYYVQSAGNTAPLLEEAAKRLTAPNLKRLAAAFGTAQVNAAVTAYAPAAVKVAYPSAPAVALIKMSQAHYASLGLNAATANGVVGGPSAIGLNPAWSTTSTVASAYPEAAIVNGDGGYVPAPSPTMAITDLFLEFYAAGTGTTFTEAVVMTGQYLDGPIGLAFGVGYGIGTAIYQGTEYLSPGFFEDLIEFLGTPVDETADPDGNIVGIVTVGEPIQQDDAPGQSYAQYNFDQDD